MVLVSVAVPVMLVYLLLASLLVLPLHQQLERKSREHLRALSRLLWRFDHNDFLLQVYVLLVSLVSLLRLFSGGRHWFFLWRRRYWGMPWLLLGRHCFSGGSALVCWPWC